MNLNVCLVEWTKSEYILYMGNSSAIANTDSTALAELKRNVNSYFRN
jgi:hypothetical protein